ncbi:MAG: CopG family antitoxin [Actinomycetota bacterium]|nr:CopG family antitoxin [Actinomycetota bacterium]
MEEKKERIPEFKSEEEEHEFWSTHSGADYVYELEEVTESVVVTPPKRKTTVRLDDAAIERIKALAERKGMPWQTLMRSWVYERLEDEEKRAG